MPRLTDINTLLSTAQEKLRQCCESGDMRRRVLHQNLVRELAAARNRRAPAGSCRPRRRRQREGDDSAARPARRQRTSPPEVELRLDRVQQFVAGLAPSRVDLAALEEELGPDPDIEFLDD